MHTNNNYKYEFEDILFFWDDNQDINPNDIRDKAQMNQIAINQRTKDWVAQTGNSTVPVTFKYAKINREPINRVLNITDKHNVPHRIAVAEEAKDVDDETIIKHALNLLYRPITVRRLGNSPDDEPNNPLKGLIVVDCD